jgi:hypothetical protein
MSRITTISSTWAASFSFIALDPLLSSRTAAYDCVSACNGSTFCPHSEIIQAVQSKSLVVHVDDAIRSAYRVELFTV